MTEKPEFGVRKVEKVELFDDAAQYLQELVRYHESAPIEDKYRSKLQIVKYVEELLNEAYQDGVEE